MVENVKKLTDAAEMEWDGLNRKDMKIFSKRFLSSFNSQVTMFPKMMNDKIAKVIDKYRDKAAACKLSGAGSGGYLILIHEGELLGAIIIKIRKRDSSL